MTRSTSARTLADLGLTLPEALMPFLHTDGGQPYRSAKPDALAAAAELSELAARGAVRLEDDHVAADAPTDGGPGESARAWIGDVTAELARGPVKVRTWLRGRDALAVQQAAAVERGLMTEGRGRLLGFGYDRHDVEPGVRERLLATVLATPEDPRSQALASILARSHLHRRHGITTEERRELTAIAKKAADGPFPEPTMSALDLALVTVVYTSTISE
ncbi:GPP34 family phosphoprotein [Nocardioides zeae]|uniref:GPP34 family phosphoprotein n=1 Tax=Nocardioides imazamoxiresistens TaxID=3231893 RepID=A0ABU3PV78_9ACTN|nr:GPP34 family phosphoprotein [Nocardioides zeae]MDT9593116.1 GPP34 family phosphoprotein [Nocardioides zeae]